MDWSLCFVLFLKVLLCFVKGEDNKMPPKMTSIFKNEYFYPPNTLLNDATIYCKAKNGPIKYKWQKDGVNVENSTYVSVNKLTGTLKFIQMRMSDYGTYQCFASNDLGISLSKPFNVEELKLSSFSSSDVHEVRCKQYEHCIVPCRGKPTCLPESQCREEWEIGEGTTTKVDISKRVGVDGNGDLHFLWSNANDWTGRRYRCRVWQDHMNRSVVGSDTSLNIDAARHTPEVEPVLVFKEDGQALYGGKGVVRCMFSGYPAPDVEWISPQYQTIKNTTGVYEISDFGRVLTILQATTEYEGFYNCTGKGKSESRAQSVFLNVTSAPILKGDNQMQDIMVTVGKNATFVCNTSSLPEELPPSPPKWKKNGVDIQIDGVKYSLSENSRVLTMADVHIRSDTGVYQCMSENSEGVLLKEAILKVIDGYNKSGKINPGNNQTIINITMETYMFSTVSIQNPTIEETNLNLFVWISVAAVILSLIIIFVICRIKRNRTGRYSVAESAGLQNSQFPEDPGQNLVEENELEESV